MSGIRSKTHDQRHVLKEAKRLLTLGCFCIGTNQVDLEAANEAAASRFSMRPSATPAASPR